MDFDALLRPLPGNRCGEDLTFSALFDEIQEARRCDDPSVSQGEWVRPLKEADWPRVARLCEDALAVRAKDVRLAVWLTEAVARTRGFGGLADGYRLVAGLCESYWDDIHPLSDDGDQEMRAGNLDWLVTQSRRIIRDTLVTDSSRGCFSMADLESARNLAASLERNPQEAEFLMRAAPVTLDQFEAARRDTPRDFFVRIAAEAEAARLALGELERVVDAKLGLDGPGFDDARQALIEVRDTLRRFGGDVPAPTSQSRAVSPGESGRIPGGERAPGGASPGAIVTRADAIERLREVADFFRRTEPHSPVAYLADKAARWGEMSLHEWLRTVVRDDGALSHVEELLGLVTQDAPGR
ncbi:MAG: type VI secretion system protein ImpA [Azoarcus sp.]|uniref:Type VI secretion system protein ImpA n=1 Tax=Aromatoleum tolulyticum TaxID=34027 RepID=A0A1N6VCR7_9RHOO|nr:type VI secretion system protein TssA [Aromatoleum tolulyticum]MCK9985561.1 type VI secretion system protein ImpA [Azoarcus sp.]SIQ75547.1 type VI secretion system protein ImpA [Aromatoleum tolulyticum]